MLLLVSVAAIPATLYPHDGQPLPRWPFSISINALLSIYSMTLKACLGFLVTSCIGQLQWSWYLEARPLKDVVSFHEAANGILGSMRWLWVNRLCQPLTALGALITIVAISIDPFVQQLIQPADCSEILPKDIPASVPRTNYLRQQDIPGSLEPALLAGLYSFQNLTDFNCSTGNCTFQNTYSSLSFCSQCSDRSSEVVIDEHCSVLSFEAGNAHGSFNQEPCNAMRPVPQNDVDWSQWNLSTTWPPFSLNFYKYTLDVDGPGEAPDVFSVQAERQDVRVDDWSLIDQGFRFGAILGYSDSAIFRSDPAVRSEFLSGCDDSATNDTWRCRGYGAAECVLQPCVRTYSCSIVAGRINETVVDESNVDQIWGFDYPGMSLDGGTQPLGLLDLECVTDDDRGSLVENGYDVDAGGRWLPYNITFDPSSNAVNASSTFPESLLTRDCLYIIDKSFVDTLWQKLLSPLLVGSVNRSADGADINYIFQGTEQLLHLYNSGNVSMASIDEKFANLAQALTLWMRAYGDPRYSRRAEGDVLRYAVCLRVTWAWISLPATLTGLVLVMLALTVATTARSAVPVWKLFPLAVLLCGPAGDDWVDRNLLAADTSKAVTNLTRDDGSIDDMSRLSSKISVQLLQQDGKYQLRQVGARPKQVQD